MNDEAMHAARLVMLEGALCALLREAAGVDGGPDGIKVEAFHDLQINELVIDIQYTRDGIQVAGESL